MPNSPKLSAGHTQTGESVATRNAVVTLAVIAGGATVYWLKGILTPLALAIFLLVMIDSLIRLLKRKAPMLPQWAPITIALIVWVGFFALTAFIVAANANSFYGQVMEYAPRLNGLIERLSSAVGMETPPSVQKLVAQFNLTGRVGPFLMGLQNFASDAIFVLIYLGFLIASRAGFQKKIVRLFPQKATRADAVDAFQRIRTGVEQYLWIQTVTGFIIAAASWAVMEVVGLNNAFFWAFLIFVAGYIPVIGGAVGVLVPPVFALIQFPNFGPAIILFVALNVINFVVANVILPRMQGSSLNLDPVVVLLALAFWGAIWGVAGMFLSTPLTVMAMVILAQFKGTEWIAILMSGNGDPLGSKRATEEKAASAA